MASWNLDSWVELLQHSAKATDQCIPTGLVQALHHLAKCIGSRDEDDMCLDKQVFYCFAIASSTLHETQRQGSQGHEEILSTLRQTVCWPSRALAWHQSKSIQQHEQHKDAITPGNLPVAASAAAQVLVTVSVRRPDTQGADTESVLQEVRNWLLASARVHEPPGEAIADPMINNTANMLTFHCMSLSRLSNKRAWPAARRHMRLLHTQTSCVSPAVWHSSDRSLWPLQQLCTCQRHGRILSTHAGHCGGSHIRG
jgi:hypothetical protein